MGQVVGDVFRRMGDIGRQFAIGRRLHAGQRAQGRRRRHALRQRADAADARRDGQGVGGGAARAGSARNRDRASSPRAPRPPARPRCRGSVRDRLRRG